MENCKIIMYRELQIWTYSMVAIGKRWSRILKGGRGVAFCTSVLLKREHAKLLFSFIKLRVWSQGKVNGFRVSSLPLLQVQFQRWSRAETKGKKWESQQRANQSRGSLHQLYSILPVECVLELWWWSSLVSSSHLCVENMSLLGWSQVSSFPVVVW